jgi:hypothetical protein
MEEVRQLLRQDEPERVADLEQLELGGHGRNLARVVTGGH